MNIRTKTVATGSALALASLVGMGAPAVAASSAPTAPSTPTQGCATGKLPAQVVGAPGVKAGQALGAYLWHDQHGYALRVTHPGKAKDVFTGRITVSRALTHVQRVALERNDSVTVSKDHKTLSFRFANYGQLDGLNFAAECSKTVHVSLSVGGKQLTPAQVRLGQHRSHPTSNPFTIERS